MYCIIISSFLIYLIKMFLWVWPCVHVYAGRRPWVCGISSLGIDHTSILGDTVEKIAWQKGGIFKVCVCVVLKSSRVISILAILPDVLCLCIFKHQNFTLDSWTWIKVLGYLFLQYWVDCYGHVCICVFVSIVTAWDSSIYCEATRGPNYGPSGKSTRDWGEKQSKHSHPFF